MSDVVVSVTESTTAVTVSEQDVAVAVTESVTQVSASSVGLQGVQGIQGDQGASGVVSVTTPITNSGSSSSAIIGIDLTNIAQRNSANTFTVGGHLITNAATAIVPLAVRGAASQSANLQEWQDSSGATVASISSIGLLNNNTTGIITSYTRQGGAPFLATLSVGTNGTAQVGAVIRGVASQSANLQEWQNSGGTVLAKISSTGGIYGTNMRTLNDVFIVAEENSGAYARFGRQTTAAANPGANSAKLYFRDGTNTGTLKLVVRAGTAGAETTILDNIPTT